MAPKRGKAPPCGLFLMVLGLFLAGGDLSEEFSYFCADFTSLGIGCGIFFFFEFYELCAEGVNFFASEFGVVGEVWDSAWELFDWAGEVFGVVGREFDGNEFHDGIFLLQGS